MIMVYYSNNLIYLINYVINIKRKKQDNINNNIIKNIDKITERKYNREKVNIIKITKRKYNRDKRNNIYVIVVHN